MDHYRKQLIAALFLLLTLTTMGRAQGGQSTVVRHVSILPATCQSNREIVILDGSGLYWCSAPNTWSVVTTPPTTPAGSDTQVQYNNLGAFGASSNFTFTSSTNRMKLGASPGFSTTGSAGNYTLANSAITMFDNAGSETGHIWFTDPDVANYNTSNIFIGFGAGANHPTDNVSAGYYNIGIGLDALKSVTTGFVNYGLGIFALKALTTGTQNMALGFEALQAITTASDNMAIGSQALGGLTGTGILGSRNVAIGTNAANLLQTGQSNIAIGFNTQFANTNPGDYQLNIGNIITGQLGGESTGSNGINSLTFASGVTIAVGAVTSNVQGILGTATWNSAGVTFTNWKMNVTDTASAAGSLLMDLQVGSASKYSVDKAGNMSATGVNITTGGSTTISTGVGSVRMSTVNAATNAAWIPISYAGTVYYVPGFSTNAP